MRASRLAEECSEGIKFRRQSVFSSGSCELVRKHLDETISDTAKSRSEVVEIAFGFLAALALVGAVAYFSVFSFAILAAFGYARVRLFLLFTVWSMFAVTLWLLYAQAFILHAFCRYCLFSAAMVFLLAGLIVASRSP